MHECIGSAGVCGDFVPSACFELHALSATVSVAFYNRLILVCFNFCQDIAKRKGDTHLEIFAGAFPDNCEPPPSGFYFEVIDDYLIFQINVDYSTTKFLCYGRT